MISLCLLFLCAVAPGVSGATNTEKGFSDRQRGESYQSLNRYNDAVTAYTAAIAFDNRDALAHVGRAICYFKLKKYEQSANDYTSAITLAEEQDDLKKYIPLYCANRGEAYFHLNRLQEASMDYREALKHSQYEDSAYKKRGDDHYSIDEYSAAAKFYRLALNGDTPEMARARKEQRISTCKTAVRKTLLGVCIVGKAFCDAAASSAATSAAMAQQSSNQFAMQQTNFNLQQANNNLRNIDFDLQNINNQLMFSNLRY